MIRKQIYLEETMIETIKKLAREKDLTQSEIIREAILKYIQEEQVKGKVVDPLLALIGIANESDAQLTDGSENHDYYLYGGLIDD